MFWEQLFSHFLWRHWALLRKSSLQVICKSIQLLSVFLLFLQSGAASSTALTPGTTASCTPRRLTDMFVPRLPAADRKPQEAAVSCLRSRVSDVGSKHQSLLISSALWSPAAGFGPESPWAARHQYPLIIGISNKPLDADIRWDQQDACSSV